VLDSLERREMLSVVKPAAIVAAATSSQAVTTITGHIVGFPATAGVYVRTLLASYSGHGHATPLGYVNWGSQQLNSATNAAGTAFSITKGTGLVSDAAGAQVFFKYTGDATIVGKITSFNLMGTITSGTGPFANAGGTMSAFGTLRNGHLSLTFTLKPTFPV
jgi:hypothetical protein